MQIPAKKKELCTFDKVGKNRWTVDIFDKQVGANAKKKK